MSIRLYIASGMSFVIAFAIFVSSKTVFQDSLAANGLICSVVLFSSVVIGTTLNRIIW